MGDNGNQIKFTACLAAICFISVLAVILYGLHRLRDNQIESGSTKAATRRLGLTDTVQTLGISLEEYIRKHELSELLVFNFDIISIATNNFSIKNKLGEGGFGPVYKGKLGPGKEIAVKRLSSSSGQGIQEFNSEMSLISKLQHKNLVRIMGFCVKENEKLLIYEFMPNKSLDTLLFDQRRRAVLGWARRFNIIQGVARGLLYLHHDSCLKVIHRDLKVSNILLDEKMNPKISDFGLARIVHGSDGTDLENTQKVVGTLGYMSPEYAMGGIFSEKSDVYSFGVLVLEIISSKKNSNFYFHEQQLGFLAYAWHLWTEGKGVDFVGEELAKAYSLREVMRCIHIGLLCVQDDAADRPIMPEWNQWILSRVFQKAMKINEPECKETRVIGSGGYSAEPSSSSSSSVSLPPLFDSSPYYPTNASLTDRDSCSHDNRTPMEHVSCFSTNTGTSDDLMTSLDLAPLSQHQTSSLHGFGGLSDFPSSLGSLQENLQLPFLFSQGMQPHQPYYPSTTGSSESDLGDWSSLGNWRAATAEEPESLAPAEADYMWTY